MARGVLRLDVEGVRQLKERLHRKRFRGQSKIRSVRLRLVRILQSKKRRLPAREALDEIWSDVLVIIPKDAREYRVLAQVLDVIQQLEDFA